MRNKILYSLIAALFVLAVTVSPVLAAGTPCDTTTSTVVPGHCDRDGTVVGHYTSVYAYDANGNWYWDLGDGRIQGTVPSISALNQSTLSRCDYVVNYRADFGSDPYMDNGWIINDIRCYGYDGAHHYMYLIVSQTDPRYTGNPANAVWGTWEYKVLAESGFGNFVRPDHAVGLQ